MLAAATRLFVERGWAGTSMRDVARAAGCSVETVYASVGAKRELLKVALDIAVVGDDEPVPLLARDEIGAIEAGSPAVRAEAAAALCASIYRRTAGLNRVLDQARVTEPELAGLWAETRADFRTSLAAVLERVAARALTGTELDALCAVLGSDVYFQLTGESGWPDEHYET
ncbi:TetR/AcrR family transcriptional regulator [Nocardia sp. NPDC057353]|uniref:TetR/AcrR family transcriptional regulator n=1 Tax=Nocardia sp. NPDC057353 TaxID=3346104 RepID=UPI003629F929